MSTYIDAVNGKHTDGREQETVLTGQALIDEVLDQIQEDIRNQDFTALEELLQYVPEENLRAYLPIL